MIAGKTTRDRTNPAMLDCQSNNSKNFFDRNVIKTLIGRN
jgi:hypothetical protein